jgi:hypothetical protein
VDFMLGFLTGIIAALGLLGFLTYWLCSRSNNIAVAKFINGIAQALAHKGPVVEKAKDTGTSIGKVQHDDGRTT